MIARIRFVVDSKGSYAEQRIAFPGENIVHIAEQIEALCQGYRLGSMYKCHLMGLETTGQWDWHFDSKQDAFATAGYFFNLRAKSIPMPDQETP